MKQKIIDYIADWENKCYSDGIPDEAPIIFERSNKVPSYRMICIAILKNDRQLEMLGYSRIKCKAYMDLKRIELLERGVIKPTKQLKLNI